MRRTVSGGRPHLAATRLTGAASQSWATAVSSRVVSCAFLATKGRRSVRIPQRGQRTRWISTTNQTCQVPQGRSRIRRSVQLWTSRTEMPQPPHT